MIKFLGSVWFAILLILLTALFVIAGTFIESASSSHKQASDFIYSNPLFILLLWGFFINILVSLISRFPLKKHHLPFVLAHIGLLMLISGALLKITHGFQGFVQLKEGEQSVTAFRANSEGITLQFKDRDKESFPLSHFKVLAQFPHGEAKHELWFKKEGVVLFGHRPLPLNQVIPLRFQGSDYHFLAYEGELENLKPEIDKPLLFLFKDRRDIEHLIAVNEKGEIAQAEYDPKSLKHFYAYDEGFLGYGLGFKFFDQEIETPLTQIYKKKEMPSKKEEARPLVVIEYENEKIPLLFKNPLPTPFKNGLWRFEEEFIKLPFSIRLMQARALFYPNSNQPFSYEADILINDSPITLSMNHVYESPEGYRLYLSNIAPMDKGQVKTVQLVINRDPFKMFLTYPGAIILTLGIILLLFFRKQLKAE